MAESFGELLRQQRVRLSLTQEALAERAGLSADAIAAIEQGRRRPRLSTVRLIADALDLSPTDRALLVQTVAAAGRAGSSGGRGVEKEPDSTAGPDVSPARSLPHRRAPALPAPLAPLIGRLSEIDLVTRALTSERLVTLVGPGGVGKTRLALAVASATFEAFAGGTWWVELGAVSDSGGVALSVLSSFGLSEQPGVPPLQQVLPMLPDAPCLLVVDNCEHVLDEAAAIIGQLLDHAPLTVLATSRERLGIPGEVRWPVLALAVPEAGQLATAGRLAGIDSARLFVERARRADPGFALTDANSTSVARICRRLEGVPLAIELAAARVSGLMVGPLADELDEQVPLAGTAARGVPPRHSTLLACTDWSYELLNDQQRKAFRCLAGFAGSFSAAAFVAVVGDVVSVARLAAGEMLADFVEKSLVTADTRSGRYHCLEVIRTFAADRALEASELEGIYEAHAAAYASWLGKLGTANATDQVLDLLAAEFPNVRAALVRSIAAGSSRAAEIVAGIGLAWHEHSHFQDARVLGDGALALSEREPLNWARAAAALGSARRISGDEGFRTTLSRAEAIASAAGDALTEGQCLFITGLGAPFDPARLTQAYELSTAATAPVVAGATAAGLACGGADEQRELWLELSRQNADLAHNSSLSAAYSLALADSLVERGRLREAFEAAENATSVTRVMPLNRLRGIGQILQISVITHQPGAQNLVARLSRDLAGAWPLGADWQASTWTALAELLRLWSALLHGQPPPPFDPAGLGRMNRNAVTPSVVRMVCRAALDRGELPDASKAAHGAVPPAPDSLMGLSITAVEAAIASAQTDDVRAVKLWSRVLASSAPVGFVLLACDALEALACTASRGGEFSKAAHLLSAAQQRRDAIGYSYRFGFEQREVEQCRETLSGETTDNRALPWAAAVQLALSS